jgi:outer membrane protein TolC
MVIILFITWCSSVSMVAQTSENNALTLDQCLSIAIQQNPLVLSSMHQYHASLARVNQAKAFAQPYLYYMMDYQSKFIDFKSAKESYLGLGSAIEFPGKRSIRGKIATKESDEIMQDIELLKLGIVFQVKQAFFGLLLAQEKLGYAQQNLELSRDFQKKAEMKFDAGDVAKVEALRARVEASKAANEVRAASNDVVLAKAMLNFLLARKKYSPLEIQGNLKRAPIDLDEDELLARAFSFRPELKRIDFSLEKENLRKKQGYLSYLPDFDLSISRHHVQNVPSTWSYILIASLPLFFWQPKKGEIAEAQANINSLESDVSNIKNSITLEVEEAYMNAQTASNQIRLFEDDIITQAEEVYNMILFSYQEGEIGSIELIEARRTLIEARKSYAEALFNYGVAIAALEKSIGQKLEGGSQ